MQGGRSQGRATEYRFAFAGLRHSHIFSLIERVSAHPACQIVAAWEADDTARAAAERVCGLPFEYSDFDTLLSESGCNVVAIGDTYARRGALAIRALKAGCHVIADKPLCTSLEELGEISSLARAGGLSVGCMLDLTEAPAIRGLREIIRDGKIGSVQTVTILAQHPLLYGQRAGWYFAGDQHGGTVNDIGVHVFDLLPWLTGSAWERMISVREWNAKAKEAPHFCDCAQMYGTLENGVSCFADLSYLAPDRCGYSLAQYWRLTVHGTSGMAEASYGAKTLSLATDSDEEIQRVALTEIPASGRNYLQNFLDEISAKDQTCEGALSTEDILKTTRLVLQAQQIASEKNEDSHS
ncbi:Gfo/Idh/MocA family oxidoreductase [Ruficoccus amylovorans]|uniref:Gfo/Idh/MocA family oxidoreductase n=2 Tax=Ruficoccus amylovorans TaxID=1804625 RepID=A0A842HGB1_9BACT|nr:Gfo/Idh/MocA family oxidoreductase [Ruficoccus amylovorans]